MSQDFMAAMRRSLDAVRAGDPAAATRMIQSALGGGTAPASAPEAEPASEAKPRRRAPRVEDAEVLGETPPRARSSLRETVARLRRRSAPAAAPEIAPGAVWEERRHASPFGTRAYKLYVPAAVAAGGAAEGLVVMLHGCTQNPDDFARGTRMNALAETHGLVVAYPAQERTHNMQACWNWFQPGDQGRSGESALVADLARALAAEHGVAGRVMVAGLSAGGAMAAETAEAHPEIFAAAGIHSGLVPGSARDMPGAFAAMRGDGAGRAHAPAVPTILFHGDADRTVAPANAEGYAKALQDAKRRAGSAGGRAWEVEAGSTASGTPVELWRVRGAGHAWQGGDASGSYADAAGPDASAEMVRFLLARG
ncbi:PHB depolymerase family esterase [Jannaschia sp. W003]|uniref:extracellular catalytic domain type 1 short-chain-length polyhydroxyalkanoate depolymerase n=1 Tax=Jannaschia sp. W003 TaxID=2867012 RepID=UPI0021A3C294|nr:PHB depolymerase family esterase [Jannaschia sp. W003]UWQ22824.1 PHB depolymerase family esterase [Jannaschia sp. W003]